MLERRRHGGGGARDLLDSRQGVADRADVLLVRITRTADARSRVTAPNARKTPRGARIARWYCPHSHTTFSLLSDCLAARLPGTLDELEAVAAAAEQAPSVAAAANRLRTDAVGLPVQPPGSSSA